jgi:hypothetical protein
MVAQVGLTRADADVLLALEGDRLIPGRDHLEVHHATVWMVDNS